MLQPEMKLILLRATIRYASMMSGDDVGQK